MKLDLYRSGAEPSRLVTRLLARMPRIRSSRAFYPRRTIPAEDTLRAPRAASTSVGDSVDFKSDPELTSRRERWGDENQPEKVALREPPLMTQAAKRKIRHSLWQGYVASRSGRPVRRRGDEVRVAQRWP